MEVKLRQSEAPLSIFLEGLGNSATQNLLMIVLGIILLSFLAQVSIHLPWTPVPITGQTFGVTLMALCWGQRRGAAILLGYVTLGILGAPVFAEGASGFMIGPTTGYLIGMIISSFIVGRLADKNHTGSFKNFLAAGFVGSAVVFFFGLAWLSFFVPFKWLLVSGFFPFIPGDIVKTTTASILAFRLRKKMDTLTK